MDSTHGDFPECHADEPRCGCVAKVYPYGQGIDARQHADTIGGTVTLERVDPDSKYVEEQWEVRFPRA